MTFGYAGRLLDIDLSTNVVSESILGPELLRKYLGGTGLGTKILMDEVDPWIDPLSPQNVLILATGPLTGTLAPTSARVELTFVSPLTEILGASNVGGFWGPTLKYAGYDLIVIRGKAEDLSYLWIDDRKVEVRRAEHLRGKDTWETTNVLRKELGETYPHEVRVMAIGPAGENLVKFAAITSDYVNSASRCGPGAVMGSKNLKAIAARGTGGLKVAQPREFLEAVKRSIRRIQGDPNYNNVCFPGPLDLCDSNRISIGFPGRNFQTGVPSQWDRELATSVGMRWLKESPNPRLYGRACHCCPMACYRRIELGSGKYKGLTLSGLFVGFVKNWGGKVGLTNFPVIWKCEEQLQKLGMDSASAAGTISFAMELFERGIITSRDTGGVKLTWGDEDAVLQMLSMIAHRKGFGDILAEGSYEAALRIGGEAKRYVMAIKRLEMNAADPRTHIPAWSFSYITNPRGGDNIRTTHLATYKWGNVDQLAREKGMDEDAYRKWIIQQYDMPDEIKHKAFGEPPKIQPPRSYVGIPLLTKWYEEISTLHNMLGSCILDHVMLSVKLGPTFSSELFNTCTGEALSPQQLVQKAEMVFNLQRLYLILHGSSRKDDEWPDRFYTDTLPGNIVLSRQDVSKALDEYYKIRGWHKESGIPTETKLVELGLDEYLDKISSQEKKCKRS